MKTARIILFVLCSCWGMSAQAEMRYFFDLPLVGSELDAPKPTDDWDLGLERGLSITPGIGIQFDQGQFQFDVLLEWFNHASFPLISDDEVLEAEGYLVKFIGGVRVAKNWRIFAGFGMGDADISNNYDSCRSPSGCPGGPWPYPPQSSSANIKARLIGVAWSPQEHVEYSMGFQNITSDALGFTDVNGTPYAVDELDLPTSFIAVRFIF
jgi:hypothetical protein